MLIVTSFVQRPAIKTWIQNSGMYTVTNEQVKLSKHDET